MFQVPGGDFVTVKKVEMPARPFVGINEEDIEEIREMARLHLASAFGLGGGK